MIRICLCAVMNFKISFFKLLKRLGRRQILPMFVLRILRRIRKGDYDVFRELFYITLARLASVVFFYLRRDVWLVAERLGMSAEENGYAFFKYCLDNHKDKKVYYVLNKEVEVPADCPEPSRVIRRRGLRNFILLLKAESVFFTNDPRDALITRQAWLLKKVKTIFLRHGVGLYSHGKYLQKRSGNLDVVCCVSEREKKILTATCALKNNRHLRVLGQPRFDDLYNCKGSGSYILMSPTWRYELAKKGVKSIEGSEFIKRLYEFFEATVLQAFLEENKLKIHFRVHFKLMQFLPNLKLPKNIILEDEATVKMKDSLKNSKLLITDYSSIMWDMAYMEKPVILYQFDRAVFLKERSKSSFNMLDEEMFCPIVFDVNSLVSQIKKYFHSDYTLSIEEKEKLFSCFDFDDSLNCQRIFDAALEIPSR